MLTSEQLHELETQAEAARAAKDAAAGDALLLRLLELQDSEFAAFDLEGLKKVRDITTLLFGLGNLGKLVALLGRCINAMSALPERPPAAEYIVPFHNLRAFYLAGGATKEADQLVTPIINAARQADTVSDGAMEALNGLLEEVEKAGLTGPAVELYRPICLTVLAKPEAHWREKLETLARMGRRYLANGQPQDALQLYEQALEQADTERTDDTDSVRMLLWNLIGEVKVQVRDPDGVEQAYENAKAFAESSGSSDSRDAAAIYRNLASLWFAKGQRERYPEAVTLVLRSLDIAERIGEGKTPRHASGLGLVARMKAALGESAEAQRYYDACFAAFAATHEADPSDVADFRMNEGLLRLEAGQAEDATASFIAARELFDGNPGCPDNQLAETDGWIGVALFESGRFAEAGTAFRRALDLRMTSWKDAAAQGVSP